MAADFDKPTVSNTHVNVLSQLRDNQTSLARMFSDGGEANIPPRSVRFLNNTMYLWNGSTWDVAPVAIGGGGTGAETAANARANLGTDVATNVTSGVFSSDRIPTISIADKTSGTLDGDRVDQSTTSERGTVQLSNTLTSTSTTQALTAAQGKALQDNKLTATANRAGQEALGIFHGNESSGSGTPSGWSVAHTNTGRYTVTHNLGISSYTVVAMVGSHPASDTAAIEISKGTNSFDVLIFFGATDWDSAFTFTLMKW